MLVTMIPSHQMQLRGKAYHSVHLKDTQRNQPRKRGRKDISRIQDGDSRRQLLARIEGRQDVQRTGVVRSLADTEEEPREEQAGKVAADGREAADDGPDGHAARHPQAGADASDDHVGGDADDDVSGEEDGDAGLVLGGREVEICFEGVEPGQSNGVAVLVLFVSPQPPAL